MRHGDERFGIASMNGNMYNVQRRPANGKVRRRQRVTKKGWIIAAVILALYVALLSCVTYFVLYKPSAGSPRRFIERVTDENGNEITISHDYETVDGTYNILLLGLDREAMLTDVFMLININNNTGGITVMQLPRDTYVQSVDGVSTGTNKLNELFADHYLSRQRSGENDPVKPALLDVTSLIEDSLCIDINYSAIMDLEGFRNIVDILGGVEIDVPAAMTYYDPAQNLNINIPAGHQLLDGAAAEGFVRYRSGYLTADLGRQNAQKIFLVALFNRMKSSLSITNVSMLTELAGEISKNLTTDMSAADIVFFAKSLLSCDLSGINLRTLPGNTNATHYVMNRTAAISALNQNYNIYDKEITNGIFDRNGMFNSDADPSVYEIYYASPDGIFDSNVYNGSDINSDSIDIPRR